VDWCQKFSDIRDTDSCFSAVKRETSFLLGFHIMRASIPDLDSDLKMRLIDVSSGSVKRHFGYSLLPIVLATPNIGSSGRKNANLRSIEPSPVARRMLGRSAPGIRRASSPVPVTADVSSETTL